MRQKNFTCVFPSAENVHLVKDVGMIANTMAREHGWDSRLVCLDKGRDFPYLDIADRLAIDRIADDPGYRRFRDPPRSLDAYLRRRARDIDVLQLFHNTRETRRIAVRFRKLNPRGVVYVKLDADEEWLRREIALVRRDRLRWITEHLVAQVFLRRVPDLLTIETDSARRTFSELYPWSAAKLSVLPNGYDENWLRANGLADPGPEDKEDLVIAVGRVGSPQKNHEMLLQALRGRTLGNWRVGFVGPVEPGFEAAIAAFRGDRPDLEDRVFFTGEIVDRRELYSWYARAKVFCLTSGWESWCFALMDALRFGCHFLSTPIQSLDAISDHGRLGGRVETAEELGARLQEIFDGGVDVLANFRASIEHCRKFSWSGICDSLEERLRAVSA